MESNVASKNMTSTTTATTAATTTTTTTTTNAVEQTAAATTTSKAALTTTYKDSYKKSLNNDNNIMYWKEGIYKKSSFTSIKNWSALSLTLDGRDKLTKTLQYICRLLAWWYRNSSKKRAQYYSLYKSLATSRKAFRLGRFIIEFEKLYQILPQIQLFGNSTSSSKSDDNCAATTTTNVVGRSSSLVYASRMLGSISSFSLNGGSSAISAPYNRIQSSMMEATDIPTKNEIKTTVVPLWKSIGIPLKLVGLAGFFFSDNILFLSQSNFLSSSNSKKAQIFAMRSYFFASLVGWYVNYKEFILHRLKLKYAITNVIQKELYHIQEEGEIEKEEEDQTTVITANYNKEGSDVANTTRDNNNNKDCKSATNGNNATTSNKEKSITNKLTKKQTTTATTTPTTRDGYTLSHKKKMEAATARLQDEKAKNFVLFLALLKSTADVLVFSNNPGIDLHQKVKGRKMNEGIHCLCGLISAGCVLFNHFPNRNK